MNMLSFFKKLNQKEQLKSSGMESRISSKDLLQESDDTQKELVETELSIHPDWNLSQEQIYVLRFLNNDLQPLEPNQISIAGVEYVIDDEILILTAFVRNSMSKPLNLGEVPLLLLDKENNLIAKKLFDLGEMGSIPGRSSRPWNFVFEKSLLNVSDFPLEGWSLAFQVKQKHMLDLDDSWKEQLPIEEQKNLEDLVESMEPPKKDEVNFVGLQVRTINEGKVAVTLLIRNGSHQNLVIEKLPLHLIDANDEIVATGTFTMPNFQVKPNSTKPWTFIFPKELLKKDNPDFSKWNVIPVYN